MSASHMLAWYQEGFLPDDLLVCGITKFVSSHPAQPFYKSLKDLFRMVKAGLNYVPVTPQAVASGCPTAHWCEVSARAVVAVVPPPALVPALEQLRQLAVQMAAQTGATRSVCHPACRWACPLARHTVAQTPCVQLDLPCMPVPASNQLTRYLHTPKVTATCTVAMPAATPALYT
jgi:hypothetical protein